MRKEIRAGWEACRVDRCESSAPTFIRAVRHFNEQINAINSELAREMHFIREMSRCIVQCCLKSRVELHDLYRNNYIFLDC
jgi:hypothetical protein